MKRIISVFLTVFILVSLPACHNSSESSESTKYYYVTPYGEKYHKESCRYIQNAENGYKKITAEQAERNYSPCKVCKP